MTNVGHAPFAGTGAERLEEAAAHVAETVRRSGSSFSLGMRILPPEKREAMYAVYAFCREIDDIADEPAPLEEKRAGLRRWRAEVDRIYRGEARSPTGQVLQRHVARFGFPKEEFELLIDGMEMDAEGPIVAPPMEVMLAYCRRVAGAVGLLSMRIFEAGEGAHSDRFALALADALQITNILRDVEEDAAMGRLYVAREALERAGVPVTDPDGTIRHPAFPAALAELGALARQRFAEARREVAHLDRRRLKPALCMLAMYEPYLDLLEATGFDPAKGPVRLSKARKLLIALKALSGRGF